MRDKAARWVSALALVLALGSQIGAAQTGACTGSDRVVARHWDAVLRRTWELRQDCAHPGWPPHLVAALHSATDQPARPLPEAEATISRTEPSLIHAGEHVRLWHQDDWVRIEMQGVAEQPARRGDRLQVRVTRQSADGITTEDFSGTARASGSVEMDR